MRSPLSRPRPGDESEGRVCDRILLTILHDHSPFAIKIMRACKCSAEGAPPGRTDPILVVNIISHISVDEYAEILRRRRDNNGGYEGPHNRRALPGTRAHLLRIVAIRPQSEADLTLIGFSSMSRSRIDTNTEEFLRTHGANHDRAGDADRPRPSPRLAVWPRPRESIVRFWTSRPTMQRRCICWAFWLASWAASTQPSI